MRRILFTFLLCLTAGSALLTACRHADDAWMAQRQALFRLIVSVHNSGQEEIACKLDSLNRTALPADRHARALWQLAQAWLTVSQIAILMAVSPSSVSQQKSRLKKRLQQSEGY